MPQSPHILFLNEFYHPDICASAVVAADHLPKIARLRPDWRLTILCGDRAWDDPSTIYPARDKHDGVRIVRVARPAVSRTNLFRRFLGFAAFQRSAIKAASSLDRIDLVVGTTAPPQGGSIARRIARDHGCPYIYKVLDLYPDLAVALGRTREGSFIHRRWRAADTRAMRDAAAVICIAERMTQRLPRTRELPGEKLHTIHDGYDPERITANGPNNFRERYNPDGRFVVQYAGNMGLSHPFDAILAAARSLASDDGILFQFIGDGPQRETIRANLPAGAQLLNYQPPELLGHVLATADVCLISQNESMFDMALPYKIYASLAAARPVIFIGSRKSEIAEWLESSGAGCCVAQNDPDQLIEQIRAYRNDPARCTRTAAAAKSLFDVRFNSNHSAQRWVELIDGALK